MSTFSYEGINKSKKEKGTIDGQDELEVTKMLHEKHILVTSIKQKRNGFNISLSKNVPAKEKIIFTRQLAIMIKAGMPVVQALTALSEQTENENLRLTLQKAIQEVKGGQPLSTSLAKFPKVFSRTYISVVASGEKSGKLEEVLNSLADQQEKDYDLVSKVKSAMVYPMIILIALLGVMFLVMFYIMPQLNSVFKDFGGELPATTKFLMAFSESLRKYILVYFALVIVFVLAVKQWSRHPSGKRVVDKLKIKVPVLGLMNKKLYMARFTHTLSMLISAGLPMLEAIKISGDVINNSIYTKSLADLLSAVESGIPLSESFKKDKIFPPMIGHMTNIGEQSGNLDYVLSQVASFYEKEVETTTRNLSTMIEPILMVFMGVGVGFVVISVLGPINSITNSM